MIACVLITHFYAKNELIKNPDLKGSPFVVVTGEKNNLVVIDRSVEAKAIKLGMSYQAAIAVCKNVTVIEGDYEIYQDIHQKNIATLSNISPKVESKDLGIIMVDITGLELLYGGIQILKNVLITALN